MKKRMSLLTVAFAVASLVAMALPAAAAELHEDHRNTTENGGTVEWHFVANQTDGQNGELWVNLGGVWVGPMDDEDDDFPALSVYVRDHKELRKVEHWWVRTPGGTLVTAWTLEAGSGWDGTLPPPEAEQLPGKLVLSDSYCVCNCCLCGD